MHPKLKELEEAARAATEGRWTYLPDSGLIHREDDQLIIETSSRKFEEDGKFIARANPDTVLKLVEVIGLLNEALMFQQTGHEDKAAHVASMAADTLNRIGEL